MFRLEVWPRRQPVREQLAVRARCLHVASARSGDLRFCGALSGAVTPRDQQAVFAGPCQATRGDAAGASTCQSAGAASGARARRARRTRGGHAVRQEHFRPPRGVDGRDGARAPGAEVAPRRVHRPARRPARAAHGRDRAPARGSGPLGAGRAPAPGHGPRPARRRPSGARGPIRCLGPTCWQGAVGVCPDVAFGREHCCRYGRG